MPLSSPGLPQGLPPALRLSWGATAQQVCFPQTALALPRDGFLVVQDPRQVQLLSPRPSVATPRDTHDRLQRPLCPSLRHTSINLVPLVRLVSD